MPEKKALYRDLSKLPRPRKHYKEYYCSREANENMWHAPQGLKNFQRGYYHFKSADWAGNQPYQLTSNTAGEAAKMPTYYIMDIADGMAETVSKNMPTDSEIASNRWLTDQELQIYADEYKRTGFQGGLNWYRSFDLGTSLKRLFANKKIEQPSIFISGACDWGSYQNPGALDRMQNEVCANMQGICMVKGAGHWVQQEQPDETSKLLLRFLGA